MDNCEFVQGPKLQTILQLLEIGDLATAKQKCRSILSQEASNPFILFLLGLIAEKEGEFEIAVRYFRKSIVVNPHNLQVYNHLGQALEKQGAISEAISVYRHSLRKSPNQVEILTKLANVLKEIRSFDAAIHYYQRAIESDPSYLPNFNSLGLTLQRKGEQDEAIKIFQQAITINPEIADTYYNLCGALLIQGRAKEAVETYRAAISAIPNNAKLCHFYGQALLLTGNFAIGWVQYEARLELETFRYPNDLPLPPNRHKSILADQTVLIYADQGIGDTIQFLRFLPQVVQRGAKVILACQLTLLSLIKQNQMDLKVQSLSAIGDLSGQKKIDYRLPLSSLAYYLKINDEKLFSSNTPYLNSSRCSYQYQLQTKKIRVGLVWAGNPKHVNDRFRSIHPKHFLAFSELINCQFYSLQVGTKADQLKSIKLELPIIDLSQYLNCFADTASIIEQLDLVISVDTSVAHLAGAMGKSVWMLVPAKPDWRWQLERSDSPWYPSLRLFRQKKLGLWSGVMAEMKAQLLFLIQTHQTRLDN